jgi:hypothetical protein
MPKITYRVFVLMEEGGKHIPWGTHLETGPVELLLKFCEASTTGNSFNFITAECFRYENNEEQERQWCLVID